MHEAVHEVEEVAREVEEEVEAKAAVGFLGGPYGWGLLVILALLLVYVIATSDRGARPPESWEGEDVNVEGHHHR